MKKKTTGQLVEDLAVMVKERFDDIESKMVTKDDLNEVTGRLDNVEVRLTGVETRLDKIQFFMTGHDRRIEILEDFSRQVKTRLDIK